MQFFVESNLTAGLQTDTDLLLGSGTPNGNAWTLSDVSTAGLSAGTYTIYAVGVDPGGNTYRGTFTIDIFDVNGNITDLGYGYAGYGTGLNNPLMQNVSGQQPDPSGPLPQGNYSIGRQQYNRTQTGVGLPMSMRLNPNAGNQMLKRAGFLIHGPHDDDQHDSSEGCPIFNRPSRDIIAKSNDKCFQVVP